MKAFIASPSPPGAPSLVSETWDSINLPRNSSCPILSVASSRKGWDTTKPTANDPKPLNQLLPPQPFHLLQRPPFRLRHKSPHKQRSQNAHHPIDPILSLIHISEPTR